MSKRLIFLIPPQFRKSNINQGLFGCIEEEMTQLINTATDALKQGNPQLATWGISKWEDTLNLKAVPDSTSIEVRRARVISRLLPPPVVTPGEMERIAGEFSHLKKSEVIEYGREKNFEVVVNMDGWIDHRNLVDAVKEMKPKHLGFSVTAKSAESIGIKENTRANIIDYPRTNTFTTSDDRMSGRIYTQPMFIESDIRIQSVQYPVTGTFVCTPEEV